MKGLSLILASSLIMSALAACDGGSSGGTTTVPTADTAATTATASATATATASASAVATASASASSDAAGGSAPAPSAKPVASATAATPKGTAAPTASAKVGTDKSKWSCGNKGQKACPMQGWMKGVMARAMASGDNTKIAKALNNIAGRPVPGYGSWVGIAAAGASKAAAGDIDGAKASCKKCHALYQKKYVSTMRDAPW
jgi:nucleoid-associated protein YgaU